MIRRTGAAAEIELGANRSVNEMGKDGVTDYSSYSHAELHEALSLIDRKKYPMNYERLLSEIAARPKVVLAANASTVDAALADANQRTSRPPAPIPRYGTFWPRLGAQLVDGFVLCPLTWASMSIATDAWSAPALLIWSALLNAIPIAYHVYFVARHGATWGKMVAGVRVFDKSEERLPSIWQATLRLIGPAVISCCSLAYLAVLVSTDRYRGRDSFNLQLGSVMMLPICMWSILELVVLLNNAKRRAAHDLIAGTVVIRSASR